MNSRRWISSSTTDLVPQGWIVMRSDELKEVNQFVYVGQTLNIHWDLDVEIPQRLRPRWKVLNTIKYMLKAKLDKTLGTNLFYRTILPTMLNASEKWPTAKKEQRLVITQEAVAANTVEWAHLKRVNSVEERSEWCDHGVLTTNIRWVWHITRFPDYSWTSVIVEWYPRDRKRPHERHRHRCDMKLSEAKSKTK